jgi:hypothetical protein
VFVDVALLYSGAGESRRASEHAHHAMEHLSRGSVMPEMFGDFAAAEEFGEAAGALHARNLRILLGHREFLGSLGDRAHLAGAEFTDMEERNATSVRTVRCDSAI